MVAKATEPARGYRTAAVLRQTALPFIIELRDRKGWAVPSQVAQSIGLETNRLKGTLDRLRLAGIIEIEEVGERAGRTTRRVRLTPTGSEIAKLLSQTVDIIEK